MYEYYNFFERFDSPSGVSGVSGWEDGDNRLLRFPSVCLDERSCNLRSPKAGFFSSVSKIEFTAESLFSQYFPIKRTLKLGFLITHH